ncbi:hypothetical protein NLA05_20690 [Xanthomonas citri pv. anacardii]|uniref:hypothetical protein n=1 Tax=Xanthomonas citri TaxID=346 RepID=UPI001D03E7D3|nr:MULTISPECIES: hypothetical protein [Xanthomonas]MEE5092484.1 hypothetical protein [Xanthomonas euvesicatoria]MCT8358645.1 hypothetical protein [Xanthomonas citri pv. anacardii]MCT8362695.1 hypothetical protein [Xanthomonas citri pv. anacardii]MCT8366734.1 hypothetical protein [Xanthomonas citri pv. anacardii]MCT8370765.1 hypothetical protein [Xanthomonas citri pv. anacardii]
MLPTGIGWAASVFVLVDGMTDWSCALRGLRVARVMVPMAMPKRIFVRPLTLGHAIAFYLDVELKFVRIHLGISARNTANTSPAITELVALLEKPASTAMFESMRLAVLRRAAAVHA